MGSSILGIGQSALTAAQVGVATTGHNIANATTPGYSRQVVQQSAAGGQDAGFGFVGKGTEVTSVTRVYNEFLTNQVLSAQTSSSQLSTYSTQIAQIDNLLADAKAGLSPALQDFFKGVQDLSSDPNSSASRQALLSSGESLAARFQSIGGQISEIRQGVNGQIGATVTNINVYATQIAKLNDAIEKAQAGGVKSANDLLDQRDQAVALLSKEVKVSVVKQGDSYNVFIGSGQPLVVGTKTTTLYAGSSPTDPSRTEVGSRTSGGVTTLLDEKSLTGGNLGGLFDFRNTTLDVAQNNLGRVA
ncbi:MAG: flagellar hook-associated protein FlgK, partial [Herminiimonas sp.]|nr:flagellar hook-associated protein FlgK [Herminiimonas sp.]